MRSPSRGRDAETREETGRAQAIAASAAPKTTHAGRGGAGNVRSPSRDPADRKQAEMAAREETLMQQKAQAADAHHPHTTGRGGAGNMASSQTTSRDQSEDRGRGRNGERSTERGPIGNVSLMKEGFEKKPIYLTFLCPLVFLPFYYILLLKYSITSGTTFSISFTFS